MSLVTDGNSSGANGGKEDNVCGSVGPALRIVVASTSRCSRWRAVGSGLFRFQFLSDAGLMDLVQTLLVGRSVGRSVGQAFLLNLCWCWQWVEKMAFMSLD